MKIIQTSSYQTKLADNEFDITFGPWPPDTESEVIDVYDYYDYYEVMPPELQPLFGDGKVVLHAEVEYAPKHYPDQQSAMNGESSQATLKNVVPKLIDLSSETDIYPSLSPGARKFVDNAARQAAEAFVNTKDEDEAMSPDDTIG